jgi:hypothetical protein
VIGWLLEADRSTASRLSGREFTPSCSTTTFFAAPTVAQARSPPPTKAARVIVRTPTDMAGKLIHAIADNYATHKHAKVRAWLGPRTAASMALSKRMKAAAEARRVPIYR